MGTVLPKEIKIHKTSVLMVSIVPFNVLGAVSPSRQCGEICVLVGEISY